MTTKITTDNIASETLTTILGPKVSSIVYPGDDTAANTAGGDSITLLGSGFNNGASVIVNGTSAGVVTVVSSTQITFTAPAQSAGTYVIYVINSDGGTAISIPGISYSGTPNWSTSAGNIGVGYETGSISTTVTATGDAPITYSVVSGTLPTGSSLNTSSGLISGTASATASSTTYSFTIKATDAQNQDTNRAFSITVNPDVVTWSTPTSNETYSVSKDIAIANVTMSATSASGGSITYTADALPTGLSITGANIAGTPTVAASTTTTLTATSTTTRTATRTINWVVSIANDTYFKNVTLLLNGETTVTPFINDASANSFALTINGDTKPVLFNPYTPGYYSNYFDGTGDYLTPPLFNFGTGDFTVEAWINPTGPVGGDGGVNSQMLYISTGASSRLAFRLNSLNKMDLYLNAVTPGVTVYTSNTVLGLNKWYHLAAVRTSGMIKLYVNGVLDNTPAASVHDINDNNVYTYIGSIGASTTPFIGYISNFRITNTAVYTSAFSTPTVPLTAISGTILLTCQSNRFIDNSTNAVTITKNGDVTVSPANPFTANASYSTYGSTYFDGTGDYLSIADSSAFTLGGSNFTMEAWVYPTAIGTFPIIAAQYTYPASQGFFWSLGANASSRDVNFYFYYSGNSNVLLNASNVVVLNSWSHHAVVRNSNTLTYYVNGVSVATVAVTQTATDATTLLTIGNADNGSYPFTGNISNFRLVLGTAVYTSAFTPPTSPLTAIANTSLLTLQYNGGATNQAIIDNSNFNNIITRNGNTSQGTFSPYSVTGWSNYFDGTGWLTGTSPSFSTSWTVEFWIYPTSASGTQSMVNFNGTNGINIWKNSSNQLVVDDGSTGQSAWTTVTITLNTWNHIAIVKSGSTTTGYINGAVAGSHSFTPGTITTFTIGRFWAGTYPYYGYISNVRVVNGTAVYTSAFTSPTSPLTPITNTSLLTCQSNRFVDNGPNNYTLTIGSTPSVQAFGPFGSVPEAVPISYSNYFDGTGDYLTLAYNSAFDVGSNPASVECWIYFTTAPVTQIINGQNSGSGSTMRMGVWSSTFRYTINDDTLRDTTITPAAGVWYHLCLTITGGVARFFINGVLRKTDSALGSVSNRAELYAIGTEDSASVLGYISNFRFSNGSIPTSYQTSSTTVGATIFTSPTAPLTTTSQGATEAHIKILTCQSTRMIDNSTNAFAITAVGDVKPRIFNPFGYTAQSATSYTPNLHGGSAYFDGNDYLQVLTPPANTRVWWDKNFTVECWIYPTTLTNSSYNQGGTETPSLIGNASTSSDGNYWTFGPINDGTVRFYYYNGGSVFSAVTTETVKINQWNHLAFVNTSGTGYKLYVNGVGTSNITVTGTPQSGAELPLTIGYKYYSTGSKGFTGYFSDARITTGAVYTSNFVPPTQTLTNYSTSIPSSLLLNFNNGGIIDQHGTNVLETVGNAQLSTSVKKYGSASLYFDGTGDYLTMPSSSLLDFGTGDFTFECWVYTTVTTSGTVCYINGNTGTFAALRIGVQSNQVYLLMSTNGSTWAVQSGLVGTAPANAWNHIAVTRASSTVRIFINGVVLGTTYSAAAALMTGTVNSIGAYAFNPFEYLTGYIDDLRITKGYARYTSNFTAPTSAFITK